MPRLFKKYGVIYSIITLFVVTFFFGGDTSAFAQSGDSIVTCGQSADPKDACTIGGIGTIVKGALEIVVSIGLPILFIFVAARFIMAWRSLVEGNANAYKDALQKAGNAIFGFLIVVIIIGGGLYTILSVFGIDPKILKILKMFSNSGVFTHTYAEIQLLPNYGPGSTLYEFILSAVRLVMKFFIYPALIVIWVWTGFSFVLAQGAPDALTKAKKWLMAAVITTLVIVVLQGFLFALQNSVKKIIGGSSAPTAGQSCRTPDGVSGQTGSDGSCYVGGRR